jgi:hypothetical protein
MDSGTSVGTCFDSTVPGISLSAMSLTASASGFTAGCDAPWVAAPVVLGGATCVGRLCSVFPDFLKEANTAIAINTATTTAIEMTNVESRFTD